MTGAIFAVVLGHLRLVQAEAFQAVIVAGTFFPAVLRQPGLRVGAGFIGKRQIGEGVDLFQHLQRLLHGVGEVDVQKTLGRMLLAHLHGVPDATRHALVPLLASGFRVRVVAVHLPQGVSHAGH